MEIFKYTRREFNLAALELSSIRLGTLFDYRKTEDHGVEIGDAREGKMTLGGTMEHVTYETTTGHPALERLIKLEPGAKVGKLVVTDYSIESEDLFVFSASEAFSEEALTHWHQDPHARYDSCYQIHSARLFFRAISDSLKGRADFLGFGAVRYYDASKPIDLASPLAKMHPGQLKGGTTHGHQTEIRAFWRPSAARSIEPMVIEVPELRKYCTHKFTLASSEAREA